MRPTKSRRRQGERSRSTRSIDRTHRHAATPIRGPMLTLGALAIALLAGCGQADGPGAATAAPAPVTSSADAATATSATQATPAAPAAPAATSPAPAGSDAATSANPPTANAAGGDPFAGIDPSQHDVLRAIARIDPAAAKGTSRPTPSTAAPSREAAGAGGVTGTDSARPAARPTPAAAPAPTAAAPLANGAASLPVTTTAPANGAAPTPSAATASTASAAAAAAAIVTAAPASPPPAAATQIAAASPTSALNSTNAPARAALRAIAQPRPEFPREALREGYTQGRVLAALAIDADGRVTDVTVLSATPSRSFARAAQQALRQWRYEPVGAPTSVQVEMLFRSE